MKKQSRSGIWQRAPRNGRTRDRFQSLWQSRSTSIPAIFYWPQPMTRSNPMTVGWEICSSIWNQLHDLSELLFYIGIASPYCNSLPLAVNFPSLRLESTCSGKPFLTPSDKVRATAVYCGTCTFLRHTCNELFMLFMQYSMSDFPSRLQTP